MRSGFHFSETFKAKRNLDNVLPSRLLLKVKSFFFCMHSHTVYKFHDWWPVNEFFCKKKKYRAFNTEDALFSATVTASNRDLTAADIWGLEICTLQTLLALSCCSFHALAGKRSASSVVNKRSKLEKKKRENA